MLIRICLLFLTLQLWGAEFEYPYLSRHAWQAFCDFRLTESESFDPSLVQEGDILFVDPSRLQSFTETYLPKIDKRFILISVPGERSLVPEKHEALLASEKMFAWFLPNPPQDFHDKLIAIPMSLRKTDEFQMDSLYMIHWIRVSLSQKKEGSHVHFSFYDSFRSSNKHLFSSSFVTTEKRRQKYAQHLQQLSGSLFVIVPEEKGLDSPETWEALLMGCFPVIKRGPSEGLYEELPVVFIDDWSEVTRELLEAKYEEWKGGSWPRERLYAPYWFQKVRQKQKELRKILPGS